MKTWSKRIALGIGAMLLLGAALLAFILLPAHIQIRGIEPEMPTRAELVALLEEPDRPVRISYFVTSDQRSDDRVLSHTSFVIEWQDGRMLLIDPGMDRATSIEFGALFETLLGAEPAQFYGTVPDFLGTEMARLDAIGFTHLHQDHVQGIEPICAATTPRRITALQTRDQASEYNLHTEDQFNLLASSPCVTRLELDDGIHSNEQFPGVGVFALAGHTPGSTMFAVAVGDRIWLLTGDISNVRKHLVSNTPKGLLYSYLMVPEHEARLAQLRVLLAGFDAEANMTAIVSHDAEAIAASGMEMWVLPADHSSEE